MEDGTPPVLSRFFPFAIYHFPSRPSHFSGLLEQFSIVLEASYLAAAHLAYRSQPDPAVARLRRAIAGNYFTATTTAVAQ